MLVFCCGGDGKGVDINGSPLVANVPKIIFSFMDDEDAFDAMFEVITSSNCTICHDASRYAEGATRSPLSNETPFLLKSREDLIASIFDRTKGPISAYKKASYDDGDTEVVIARVEAKEPTKSSFYLRILGDKSVGNPGPFMPLGSSIIAGLAVLVSDWINTITITADTIID